MAEKINMPRLSDTMEEGTVAKWLKKVGDSIKEGDILAEIETDKATMEFESFNEGVLLHIAVKEGETAPVDSLLAILGEKGEDISKLIGKNEDNPKKNITESKTEPEKKVENSQLSPASISENVEIITMPRLSDTMEEGRVSKWLKKIGDQINEGDVLAEIETDKATMEFESFYSGTLLYIGIKEGESAPVESTLAIIGDKNADISDIKNKTSIIEETKEIKNIKSEQLVEDKKNDNEKNEDDYYKEPAIINNIGVRIIASPLAKKMASDKGIDLNKIKGSGDNGRIIKRDIDSFKGSSSSSVNFEKSISIGEESSKSFPNSQMRKVIARRLSESKFSAPHYYLGVEFNMDNVIAFREQYNTLPETKISFNDIIVKACAMALKKHPEVNSIWQEDQISQNYHVNVGVAVAIDEGLVVPVIKFTDEKTLPEIGSLVKDYANRARNKKLKPDEMEGSTFTVSNLGMFDIQEFTSIINQPNSAILSVGSIEQKPVVRSGKIVIGNTIKLTLACDHRSVDGLTGSRFLQTLRSYVENPITLLI
jgi:pyruvate dehydrogenase E2 component (dihydrolipoamide acetyltransferase)